MDISVTTIDGQTIIEGTPGVRLLNSADDIVDLIGLSFEYSTRSLLLYAENLTEHFFDLSSGDAGVILQKLRNYHIRLAIVQPPGGAHQSSMFRQMAQEESKAGDFRIFDDKESAEAWLVPAGGTPTP